MTVTSAKPLSRAGGWLRRCFLLSLAVAAVGSMMAVVVLPSSADAMNAVLPLHGVETGPAAVVPAAQGEQLANQPLDGLRPGVDDRITDLRRGVAAAAVKPRSIASVLLVAATFMILVALALAAIRSRFVLSSVTFPLSCRRGARRPTRAPPLAF